MATPVAQTQAPKGMSQVSFLLPSTTLTTLRLTDATLLFSTRSMPSLQEVMSWSLKSHTRKDVRLSRGNLVIWSA